MYQVAMPWDCDRCQINEPLSVHISRSRAAIGTANVIRWWMSAANTPQSRTDPSSSRQALGTILGEKARRNFGLSGAVEYRRAPSCLTVRRKSRSDWNALAVSETRRRRQNPHSLSGQILPSIFVRLHANLIMTIWCCLFVAWMSA